MTGTPDSKTSTSAPPKATKTPVKVTAGSGSTGTGGTAISSTTGTSPTSQPGSNGEAGTQSAGGSGTGGKPQVPDPDKTTDVVIFGYTTNAAGEIRSLLLAKQTADNRARFVGRLSLDDVSATTIKSLEKELESIRTRNPAVSCPYGGRWVQPVIHCQVEYEGWTADGRLNDGKLLNYSNEKASAQSQQTK